MPTWTIQLREALASDLFMLNVAERKHVEHVLREALTNVRELRDEFDERYPALPRALRAGDDAELSKLTREIGVIACELNESVQTAQVAQVVIWLGKLVREVQWGDDGLSPMFDLWVEGWGEVMWDASSLVASGVITDEQAAEFYYTTTDCAVVHDPFVGADYERAISPELLSFLGEHSEVTGFFEYSKEEQARIDELIEQHRAVLGRPSKPSPARMTPTSEDQISRPSVRPSP